MIVEINTWQEFEAKRRDYSPRYVRLLNARKEVIIGYNASLKTFETHLKEIEKFINSNDLPPGVYYIDVRRIRKNEGILYKITKARADGSTPPPPPPTATDQKQKTMIVDDAELLELRVENERMKLEIQSLTEEIEYLNELIDEFEAIKEETTLSDTGTGAPKWLDTLKDLLPTIADPVIGEWRRMNDIKQAQIGYNYELLKMQQQQPQQAPPQYTKPTTQSPTLEELEAARESAPNEFYSWIAQGNNREIYESLKMGSNE